MEKEYEGLTIKVTADGHSEAVTEERVREIVREEIQRHEAGQFGKFKADLAKNLEEWANRPPFAWLDAKGADALDGAGGCAEGLARAIESRI